MTSIFLISFPVGPGMLLILAGILILVFIFKAGQWYGASKRNKN